MKVALTIWEKRISPVFDSATLLMIAEIEDTKVITRHTEPFNPEMPSHLAISLNFQDVDTLICGAISEVPAGMIEAEGIKLIPFVAGDAIEILDYYAKGAPIVPDFLMPGCGKKSYGKCRNRDFPMVQEKGVNIMTKGCGSESRGKASGTGRGKGRNKTGKRCIGTGQNRANNPGEGNARGKGRRNTGLGK